MTKITKIIQKDGLRYRIQSLKLPTKSENALCYTAAHRMGQRVQTLKPYPREAI